MKLRNKFILLLVVCLSAALLATIFVLKQVSDEAARQAMIAQENRLKTFWHILRSKGKDFSLVDGKLRAGEYVINNNFELPDKVQELFGGTATILMGDTLVSSSALMEDGSRAIGSRLQGAAYNAVFGEGRSYRGETEILGIPYFTAYDPIRNSQGETIGALHVGVKKSEFFAAYDTLRNKLITVATVNVTIFALLAFFLVRRALRTLNRLTTAAQSIADGDLDVQVPVESRDEIGMLAETFNTMTSVVFKGMQSELAKANRMVANVKETIQQLSSSASEIMAISAQQSAGATQQATAVQQAMTTAEEIAVTARQVAQNAIQVEQQAENANTGGSNSRIAVDNALLGMGSLKEQIMTVAEAMVGLGENSQQIGGIVNIIDEISAQTNLRQSKKPDWSSIWAEWVLPPPGPGGRDRRNACSSRSSRCPNRSWTSARRPGSWARLCSSPGSSARS
jgi:methyl-accepting chemotaxis protein